MTIKFYLNDVIINNKMNLCRDIPVAAFEIRRKVVGTNTIVQVDESLMRGKRKYNRGRLLRANIATENVDVNEKLWKKTCWSMGVWNVPKRRKWYYRGKILCFEKRDNKRIIQNEIEIGTEIHSDEWLAYKTSETKGYIRYITIIATLVFSGTMVASKKQQ
ncbi:DDE Tnp IS1595 domain-containing protein [Aphis craccivora]|uniref:DDE Tnp IS1595 domain-containing protein n=1 Tax=Aphis craccivora TaxID=307492 RepID=A0A6G0YTY7_APHCR|nr:DDE Tnp IS1595 domain-containing protein [Aphis craccivora]